MFRKDSRTENDRGKRVKARCNPLAKGEENSDFSGKAESHTVRCDGA